MFIVVQIAEAFSEPSQTSSVNHFAKIINGYNDEFIILSNIWDGAFSQVYMGYRGEFIVLRNI